MRLTLHTDYTMSPPGRNVEGFPERRPTGVVSTPKSTDATDPDVEPARAFPVPMLSAVADGPCTTNGLQSAETAAHQAHPGVMFVHLRRHAELSFREPGTTARLVAEPTAAAFEVTQRVGGAAREELDAKKAGGPPMR